MAKTKRCDEPSEDGSWLRTVPAQVLNCMVEEITLLHGTDDLIDTTLGQANVSIGVHTHNNMTIIWDAVDADRTTHAPRLLTQGWGQLKNVRCRNVQV